MEIESLEGQDREVANDGGALEFQGFITVIAPNITQLEEDCLRLHNLCADVLHLDSLRNQQWAGWLLALPLGQASR